MGAMRPGDRLMFTAASDRMEYGRVISVGAKETVIENYHTGPAGEIFPQRHKIKSAKYDELRGAGPSANSNHPIARANTPAAKP